MVQTLLSSGHAIGPPRTRKREWCAVLNNTPNSRVLPQHGRQQLQFEHCSRAVQSIIQRYTYMVEAVLSEINNEDCACEWLAYNSTDLLAKTQLLRSFSNNEEQILHLDVAKSDCSWLELSENGALRDAFCSYTQIPPLSLLIPIHEAIELTVINGSHSVVWSCKSPQHAAEAMEELICNERQVVRVEVGQMIFFRQDLVHAGASYETDNVRIHMYIDSIMGTLRDPDFITIVDGRPMRSMGDSKRARMKLG
jgi:hypothetical protein